MDAKAKKNELLVGLFLLIGIGVVGGLIIRFGALSDSFRESYPLTLTFSDASGITSGAPVKLGGATVGRVDGNPQLNDTFNGVVVRIAIYTGLDIPENSEFVIATSGLMGDALIEIRPPLELTGRAIAAGTEIGGIKVGGITDITSSAQDVARKAHVVLSDAQIAVHEFTRAVDKVNDGFLTDKNMQSFSKSLDSFGTALERLETKILSDENSKDIRESVTGIKETVADLKETGRNLKDGSAKIGPFIDKLDPALADVRRAASKLESTFDTLDTTAKDISTAVNSLTRGDGLLAALLNDSELKTNIRLFAANLKEHGILRYKDDAAISRDGGTVLTSEGRPSNLPTAETSRPQPRPLRSRGPIGR